MFDQWHRWMQHHLPCKERPIDHPLDVSWFIQGTDIWICIRPTKNNLNPKVMNTTMTIIWGVPYFWTNQFLASENFKMQRTTIIMKSTPQSYMKCMCFAEPLEPQFDNFGRGPYHRGIARCSKLWRQSLSASGITDGACATAHPDQSGLTHHELISVNLETSW